MFSCYWGLGRYKWKSFGEDEDVRDGGGIANEVCEISWEDP